MVTKQSRQTHGRSERQYRQGLLLRGALFVVILALSSIASFGRADANSLPPCRVYPTGSTDPDKPVLILLQGWNTSATLDASGRTSQIDVWRELVAGLSDLYRGVVYFSYNENSEEYEREDTYKSIFSHHVPLLRDLIQSCVNAGYESFDLIGHSLGGVVAFKYVASYGLTKDPGRVRHVVTLDSPVNGSQRAYQLRASPQSLDQAVVGPSIQAFGRLFLISEGDQTSPAEIAEMYRARDVTTAHSNERTVQLLLQKGTHVVTLTNRDDLVVPADDALIPAAFKQAFALGNLDLSGGHSRILQVQTYPEVLETLRRQLYSPPATTPTAPRKNQRAESSTVLLLDISGSMADLWQGTIKIEAAKNAALDVVTMMEQEAQIGNASHRVGIVTFSSTAELVIPPTTDYAQVKALISGLYPTERTNIGDGLLMSNQALASEPSDVQRFIILLSDGMTNEGLSPEEILAGPVEEARTAGICIYTVGFGEPGDLDEVLLREIASTSGCGQYYYASDAYQLQRIYLELRHRALGQVVGAFSGTVQQDETTPPETFVVPPQQEELNITLAWPGSTLDLVVTDPNGKLVDSLYPAVSLLTYARFVYMIVKNPIPGNWQLSVRGRDVPEGIINYDAVVSVRAAPPTEQRVVDTDLVWVEDSFMPLVMVVAGSALLAGLVVLVRSLSQPRSTPQRTGSAFVQVQEGDAVGMRAGLRRDVLNLGRDPRNDLALADNLVSAMHAQIRREPNGYVIYDLNSRNGTFVNGRRITRHRLRSGDRITVGRTVLVFYEA